MHQIHKIMILSLVVLWHVNCELLWKIRYDWRRGTRFHLNKFPIWSQITKFGFSSQNPVLYRPLFQKPNVISQVLALTRNKTWPFFHKKHQINKFHFLSCWRGFIFIRIFFPSTREIYWCFVCNIRILLYISLNALSA